MLSLAQAQDEFLRLLASISGAEVPLFVAFVQETVSRHIDDGRCKSNGSTKQSVSNAPTGPTLRDRKIRVSPTGQLNPQPLQPMKETKQKKPNTQTLPDGDFEYDPNKKATKRSKKQKQKSLGNKRPKNSQPDPETVLSNIDSLLGDVDLKEIINYENFENLLTPSEKTELVKFLPDVDKNSAESLKNLFRNEIFSSNLALYREVLEIEGFDASYQSLCNSAKKKENLDPWKELHYEDYWGQKLEGTSISNNSFGKQTDLNKTLFASSPDSSGETTVNENPNKVNSFERQKVVDCESPKQKPITVDDPSCKENEADISSCANCEKPQLVHINSPLVSKISEQGSCKKPCNEEQELLAVLPVKSNTSPMHSSIEDTKVVNESNKTDHRKDDSARIDNDEMEECEQNSENENETKLIEKEDVIEHKNTSTGENIVHLQPSKNEKQKKGKRKRTKNTGVSFRLGAYSILKRVNKPLSAKDIVAIGLGEGLFSTTGKTPHNTLAALLYCDIKKNKESLFTKVKAMTFGLKEWKNQS